MNIKIKKKYFEFCYKTKIVIVNIFINLILKIFPKINRKELIKIGYKKKTICIVENEYEFTIKQPSQALAKERFKKFCGPRKVDCFFGIKINDVRLIGPFGIPFTRTGKIILEPISKRWLVHVFKTTLAHMGLLGFIKQYFLAIFPIFDSKKNFLKIGAHLLCRGSKLSGLDDRIIEPVFGHWLGEQLPQIRSIEGVCKKFALKSPLIVNKSNTNWQIDSLALMGYKKGDLFKYNQNGLRVGELIISSLRNVHSRGFEFDPRARKWAAKRLQSNFVSLDLSKYKKKNVCVFRQNDKNRSISNYKSLKKNIINKKYYEIQVDNLTFLESAKNFYLANNYLSIYGSGIFNVMIMKNPKKLVEIFLPNNKTKEVFFLLSQEFNMEYKCILAKPALNSSMSFPPEIINSRYSELKDKKKEWHVPLHELDKSLI
jgi:hypothetical protein